MRLTESSAPRPIMCGCGHRVTDHESDTRCGQWWRYPDVLNARVCGCHGPWRPDADDSRWDRWADAETDAGGIARRRG